MENRNALAVVFVALAGVAASATDLPDARVNPASGYVETVQAVDDGTDLEIRHVVDLGPGGPDQVTWLTSDPLPDLGARIEADGSGNVWVAWWRDDSTDEVRARYRDQATGEWSPPYRVAEPGQGARRPYLLGDGTDTWIAYEADDSGVTAIVVGIIIDEPDPIGVRHEIGSTSFGGVLDLRLHSLSGHFWATWIDSATEVGWAEWGEATQEWQTPEYESYMADSVEEARKRIEVAVTE